MENTGIILLHMITGGLIVLVILELKYYIDSRKLRKLRENISFSLEELKKHDEGYKIETKKILQDWKLKEKKQLKNYEVVGDTYYLKVGEKVQGLKYYGRQCTGSIGKQKVKSTPMIKVLLPNGFFFSTKASNFKQI